MTGLSLVRCKSTQTIGGGQAKAQVIKDRTAKVWETIMRSSLTPVEKAAIKKELDANDADTEDLGKDSDKNQQVAETVKTENVKLQKDSTTLHWIYGIIIGAAVLLVGGIIWRLKDKLIGIFTGSK